MNIFLKYLPKTLVYGKRIGISQNSKITVFKKINKSKDSYTLTSFSKDNELLKEITVQKTSTPSQKNNLKILTNTITTIVKNFQTGKISNIKLEKQKYLTKLIKNIGTMDKNFNLDNSFKKINTQLCHKKNYYSKGKTTTYPDGSTIHISETKDKNNLMKSIIAENVKMPNGVIVNRYISTPKSQHSFSISNTERKNI